jgi:hypothetical protein
MHQIPRTMNHARIKNSSQTPYIHQYQSRLSVGLGDTLELVLLLDGVRVGRSLGSVDQLLSKALGNGLDVAESGLTGTDGQEGNGLVDTAEGRDIDGLATDGTGGTDTGGVFAGTAVDDGVDGDLNGVLVGHDVDLVVLAVPPLHSHMIPGRTISKAWATMRTAMSFFPLLRPFIMSELVRRSMMGHWAFLNLLTA